MAINGRYFQIGENASSERIYALLDNVESADGGNIDNSINDSDTEFIAEEEIAQAASTQETSLTTAEANLHVVPSDNQSKKKEKKQKRRIIKVGQKSKNYLTCQLMPEIHPNLNETVLPTEIFSLVTCVSNS